MVFAIEPKDYSPLYEVLHSLDSLQLLDSTKESLDTDLNVRFIATPLPSLQQLQLVFPTKELASRALHVISPTHSVMFLPVPDRLLQPSYLQVHGKAVSYGDTDVHRNFLLSPPGSPPIGWVQTTEDISPGGLLLFQLDSAEESSALDTPLDSHTHSIDRKQYGNQSITTIQFDSGFPSIVIHEMEALPELHTSSTGLLELGPSTRLPRTRMPHVEDDW
jgi:hypothetical protein